MNNTDFSRSSRLEPQKRRGSRSTVLACSGCLALLVLACGGFFMASIFTLREPTGVAIFWGALISAGQYDTTELVVCEGSEADQYTLELEFERARFTQFSVTQEEGEEIVGTGSLNVEGKVSQWEGIFTIVEGGTFGHCIDRIEVISE